MVGSFRAAVPANLYLKNTDFVDIISVALRDLPLSRNQLLKSTYDSCIETLKSKIKKLGICKLV